MIYVVYKCYMYCTYMTQSWYTNVTYMIPVWYVCNSNRIHISYIYVTYIIHYIYIHDIHDTYIYIYTHIITFMIHIRYTHLPQNVWKILQNHGFPPMFSLFLSASSKRLRAKVQATPCRTCWLQASAAVARLTWGELPDFLSQKMMKNAGRSKKQLWIFCGFSMIFYGT